jgi:hypothetical protein
MLNRKPEIAQRLEPPEGQPEPQGPSRASTAAKPSPAAGRFCRDLPAPASTRTTPATPAKVAQVAQETHPHCRPSGAPGRHKHPHKMGCRAKKLRKSAEKCGKNFHSRSRIKPAACQKHFLMAPTRKLSPVCAPFLHHFCTISASLFAPCFSQSSLCQPLPVSPLSGWCNSVHHQFGLKTGRLTRVAKAQLPFPRPFSPPCHKTTAPAGFPNFGFRPSDFRRPSDFGLRTSDATAPDCGLWTRRLSPCQPCPAKV